MTNPVSQWLRDYVAMMEANLGFLQTSKIDGLYEGAVERILEVRQYLKQLPDEPKASPAKVDFNARLELIAEAAAALIADVRRRYPGEELRCPFMQALDRALNGAPLATGGYVEPGAPYVVGEQSACGGLPVPKEFEAALFSNESGSVNIKLQYCSVHRRIMESNTAGTAFWCSKCNYEQALGYRSDHPADCKCPMHTDEALKSGERQP